MNKHLSIAIALATYNGERYIDEQLESISRQTRVPDELIISDDASDDTTVEIIKNFSNNVSFPVRLDINQERLGSTRNFEKAIRACNSDIIFLCDQDDVWYPEKIDRIEECFMNNTEAGAVFTDADIVNQDLHIFGPQLWKKVRFNSRERAQVESRDAFTVLLKHSVVTGATMAFRSKYRDLVLPIPEIWVHDAWIALLVSASSYLIAIPTPMVAYRQHSSNQLGLPGGRNLRKSCATYHNPRISCYESARTRVLEFSDQIPDAKNKICCLDDKLGFLRARAGLPDSRWRRLPIALRELVTLRYNRYTKAGVGSFINDLLRGDK